MRSSLLAAALLTGLSTPALAAEWVVEAHYPDRAALGRASLRFDHLIVDDRRGVVRVATNEDGIRALQSAGLTVGIDSAATARLAANSQRVQAARARLAAGALPILSGGGYATIPGYECFRSITGTYATMDDLAASHPDIAAVDEIGPTWQKTQDESAGFTMRAMRISNFATQAADPDRPKMVAFSSIHAREYAPAEVDTRFAEYLVNGYGVDPEATWLVDHNDFRLILLANPDARVLAEQQIYQRKNLDTINAPCDDENIFSQPGVDLNRNFPFHWNITDGNGSSSDQCSQTFRGPSVAGEPLVQGVPEPETSNLVSYVAGNCNGAGECSGGLFADRRAGSINPASGVDDGGAAPDDTSGFFVDIHSNAALVLWPWGDTFSDSPNSVALQTLGRRLAYFNDYTPQQSNELYLTDGTTVDTMYGLLGVAGFTVETDGFDFFQDCDSFDASTAPQNVAALRYAARSLHAPYRLPGGPDVGAISASTVAAGDDHVTITATIDDTHYNQGNGSQDTYAIKAANAYVDLLPWDPAAVAVALAATDGAFDAVHENVSGEVSVIGLAPGRHLLYVQGINAQTDDGTAGPPSAVFFDVPGPDADMIFSDGFEGT